MTQISFLQVVQQERMIRGIPLLELLILHLLLPMLGTLLLELPSPTGMVVERLTML